MNHLKRNSLHPIEDLNEAALDVNEPSVADFFQVLLHTETIRALHEAVNTLPRECKKVVGLVLKGHSTNEIAQILEISPSAVSHQKARAVKILKDKMFLLIILALPVAFA